MKTLSLLLSLLVTIIGVYMIYQYAGPITPPLLSGIAFTALGIQDLFIQK